MLNIINKYLEILHFSDDEQKIYVELLRGGPQSMLKLARSTGINRTTVYRVCSDLGKRGVVTHLQDDQGSRVEAQDPSCLEALLLSKEQELKEQQEATAQVIPELRQLLLTQEQDKRFIVRTYDGVNGFKQMLWNELKAEGEMLIFGSGEIERLVDSTQWAEKHRTKTVEAGYTIREIINPKEKKTDFTKVAAFYDSFTKRLIDPSILPLKHCVVIYNTTVATYCWRDGQKVGFEVINKAYADLQRALFEQFWSIADEPPVK